jgi:hypothetical protein
MMLYDNDFESGDDHHRGVDVSDRDNAREARHLPAALTMACNKRSSTPRSALGTAPQNFDAAVVSWQFRSPRALDDPQDSNAVIVGGHGRRVIGRDDYDLVPPMAGRSRRGRSR